MKKKNYNVVDSYNILYRVFKEKYVLEDPDSQSVMSSVQTYEDNWAAEGSRVCAIADKSERTTVSPLFFFF